MPFVACYSEWHCTSWGFASVLEYIKLPGGESRSPRLRKRDAEATTDLLTETEEKLSMATSFFRCDNWKLHLRKLASGWESLRDSEGQIL